MDSRSIRSMDQFTNAPGKKTSEYSATVFAQFVAALVALVAMFSPGFDIDSTTQTLIVTFASSAVALSTMVYTWSRTKVKQAAAQTGVIPPVIVEKAETVTSGALGDQIGTGANL